MALDGATRSNKPAPQISKRSTDDATALAEFNQVTRKRMDQKLDDQLSLMTAKLDVQLKNLKIREANALAENQAKFDQMIAEEKKSRVELQLRYQQFKARDAQLDTRLDSLEQQQKAYGAKLNSLSKLHAANGELLKSNGELLKSNVKKFNSNDEQLKAIREELTAKQKSQSPNKSKKA